ncbi:MAG: bifunctional riboflavin kinase/FAD synthetase [Ktedonobacteraceae bacterium]|nr:bifunctional riboflavin kinase/FAD synthetase [Ktedonobacteraceae bacterium]
MEYITTLAAHTPVVLTIGNFDGIHKGHQRLLHELRTMARALNCVPAIVTFQPHTLMVVRPDLFVRYLTTTEEKLALARTYGGVADSIVISFTPQVAAMTAEAFLDTLRARFDLKGLVVGANFSLGHNRKGDVAFLEHYGRQHQIQIHTVSLEEAEHSRISSTRIRALVSEGSITEANELLGHPLLFSGMVIHGDRRGRLLGFPTANIRPDEHRLLPADGVYAARILVPGIPGQLDTPASSGRPAEDAAPPRDSSLHSTVYNGVVNIGVRPTFNGRERVVEAHVLDVDLDLYEQLITIELIARLRGEQRFSGIDALKAQITADVQQARQILSMSGG